MRSLHSFFSLGFRCPALTWPDVPLQGLPSHPSAFSGVSWLLEWSKGWGLTASSRDFHLSAFAEAGSHPPPKPLKGPVVSVRGGSQVPCCQLRSTKSWSPIYLFPGPPILLSVSSSSWAFMPERKREGGDRHRGTGLKVKQTSPAVCSSRPPAGLPFSGFWAQNLFRQRTLQGRSPSQPPPWSLGHLPALPGLGGTQGRVPVF